MLKLWPVAALSLLLAGCGANNSPAKVQSPGAPASSSLKLLETGAEVMQSRPPIDAINTYLDGFHFYNGDQNGQMEAHHYVTVLNEDVMQAVIYDGNTRDARLMGVEYIISERLYKTLPPEEKKLWHSHQYEVKSGTLIAPGLPEAADHALMKRIVNTYGKTWHTWHTDQNKDLPLGVPQLMMGFTADGQANPTLVQRRDARFGVDSAATRAARVDIPTAPIDPGADAWRTGKVIQIEDPTGSPHAH